MKKLNVFLRIILSIVIVFSVSLFLFSCSGDDIKDNKEIIVDDDNKEEENKEDQKEDDEHKEDEEEKQKPIPKDVNLPEIDI